MLTVYLLEDDVKAVNQAGATGAFYHKHVIRAFASDFGERINWEINQYEHHVTFSVADEWQKENMQVVAIVSNDDPSNNKNCYVDNVEQAGFPISQANSVSAVGSTNEERTEYFTLDGRKLDAKQKGLLIVRKTNADGHQRTVKMQVR